MALSPQTKEAIRRYGPQINPLARARYGISGKDLLAKLVSGESGDQADAVSSAGARGKTQFTAGSRAEAIRRFGVDPWRSTDEAIHAAVLHLQGKINGSKGLEGYNPGGGRGYVDYILGQPAHVGGQASPGSGGGRQPSSPGPPALPGSSVQPGPDTTALLEQLLGSSQPPVASGGLRTPDYAAHPALPAGYRGISTSGGPAPKRDLSGILEAASGLTGGLPGILSPGAPGDAQNAPNGPEGGSRKGRGRVVIDPSADRAGATTSRAVVGFLQQVSAIARSPIRLGTGTNHSRLTVNGNVSEHWAGNAGDVPASGRRLIRLGQAALIAAGMPERQARRQTGGLYNVTRPDGSRVQVIFNTTEGGDHRNHLHVGLRR